MLIDVELEAIDGSRKRRLYYTSFSTIFFFLYTTTPTIVQIDILHFELNTFVTSTVYTS